MGRGDVVFDVRALEALRDRDRLAQMPHRVWPARGWPRPRCRRSALARALRRASTRERPWRAPRSRHRSARRAPSTRRARADGAAAADGAARGRARTRSSPRSRSGRGRACAARARAVPSPAARRRQAGERGEDGGRARVQLQRRGRDDRQRSLAADEEVAQVVAGVGPCAARTGRPRSGLRRSPLRGRGRALGHCRSAGPACRRRWSQGLPPIVQLPSAARLRANIRPCAVASSCTVCRTQPASAARVRLLRSTVRMRFMRASEQTSTWRPLSSGTEPPTRPVLPPCATRLAPCARQADTTRRRPRPSSPVARRRASGRESACASRAPKSIGRRPTITFAVPTASRSASIRLMARASRQLRPPTARASRSCARTCIPQATNRTSVSATSIAASGAPRPRSLVARTAPSAK